MKTTPLMTFLHRRTTLARCRIILVLFCIQAMIVGCGSQADADSNRQTSRFTTAEALLAHINQLIQRNPMDHAGMLSLYYTENDIQARLYQIEQDITPFLELQHRVLTRFDADLSARHRVSPLAPWSPATITDSTSEGRVRASAIDASGEPTELHLVRIAGRWYLSGYTLEFLAAEKTSSVEETIRHYETLIQRAAPAIRAMAARLDRDEFSTIEEVRAAWHEVLAGD